MKGKGAKMSEFLCMSDVNGPLADRDLGMPLPPLLCLLSPPPTWLGSGPSVGDAARCPLQGNVHTALREWPQHAVAAIRCIINFFRRH